MAIPAGIIVGWPGSAASIPPGWSRVNALDGRYLKGIPNASTNPGATGGSATHTHTTPEHSHDMAHTHGSTTTASASPANTRLGDSPNVSVAATHTHSVPASGPAEPSTSSSASNVTEAESNEQDRLTVIWIESDGTPESIPAGAVAYGSSAEIPAGWSHRTDTAGRYLRGATAGANGGSLQAGNATHTHGVFHLHSTSHTHSPGGTGRTGTPSSTTTIRTGTGITFASPIHSHAIGYASSTLSSVSADAFVASATNDIPHRKYPVIQSSGGRLVPGIIAVWRGTLATIPAGWVLCDGTNGTPNLLGVFVKGANSQLSDVGDSGGSAGHAHGAGTPHTHATTSHNHSLTFGPPTSDLEASNFTGPNSGVGNTHQTAHATVSPSSSVGLGQASVSANTNSDTQPPYAEVAFIQFKGTPFNVRIGGDWVTAMPRMRVGGKWVDALAHARVSGAWT